MKKEYDKLLREKQGLGRRSRRRSAKSAIRQDAASNAQSLSEKAASEKRFLTMRMV